MDIRIAGIVSESVVDGPGIRFSIYTQGCLHQCYRCHNPQTHSLEGGYLVSINNLIQDITSNPLISGVTISGGEPFLQIPELLELTAKIKELGLDIIIYSGYTYEELICKNDMRIIEIFNYSNFLIDGRFEINKKSYALIFRGSSNQRIIDLKRTRIENKIIETDFSTIG